MGKCAQSDAGATCEPPSIRTKLVRMADDAQKKIIAVILEHLSSLDPVFSGVEYKTD